MGRSPEPGMGLARAVPMGFNPFQSRSSPSAQSDPVPVPLTGLEPDLMSRFLSVVATAALVVAVSAGSAFAQDFRALARQDLQRAHDELAANHPAPAVPGAASQGFRAWLDTGLQEALALAPRVNSGDSHAYLLRYYAGGFRDSNIRVSPTFEGMGPFFGISWPGFTTGWRNGRYVVTYVKPGARGAPRVGDLVVECNAMPIEEFARAKLDRWEGNLDTEAGRVTSAPYLMWNRNNPLTAGMPSQCSFQTGRGRPRDLPIRPLPLVAGDLEAAYRATVYMPPATPLASRRSTAVRGCTSIRLPTARAGPPSTTLSKPRSRACVDRSALCWICGRLRARARTPRPRAAMASPTASGPRSSLSAVSRRPVTSPTVPPRATATGTPRRSAGWKPIPISSRNRCR